MKTVFDYKKELIEISVNSDVERGFKNLCNLLLSWGINVEDIKVSQYYCNPLVCGDNFEKVFLKEFIMKALNINDPIWKNIFDVVDDEEWYGHGSNYTYNLRIKRKQEILETIPSYWIYNNYNKVKDFFESDTLQKLEEIKKKVFPIYR